MHDSYEPLRMQVLWLNTKWRDFCEMFHSGQDDLTLLDNVASSFFVRLQETLLFDIILHVCRLTDPPTSPGGYQNLTIRKWNDPSDPKIQELLTRTKDATEFARDLRNKRIAHHDLPDLATSVVPLPTRQQIQDAIDSIRNVISEVEQKHAIATTCYEYLIPDLRGVKALKTVLRNGLSQHEK